MEIRRFGNKLLIPFGCGYKTHNIRKSNEIFRGWGILNLRGEIPRCATLWIHHWEKVHHKFQAVMGRIPRYSTLQSVCKIMSGEEDDLPNFSLEKVHLLKFAPVTSCVVDRSFSAYKRILSDQRLNMTAENMEKYLIVHCGSK